MRSPSDVSADRLRDAALEATERRRAELAARNEPARVTTQARDWLVKPANRDLLREVCAALALRPKLGALESAAWVRLAVALGDSDLEGAQDHVDG